MLVEDFQEWIKDNEGMNLIQYIETVKIFECIKLKGGLN